MKIVRVESEIDDITYGSVEPEGIRLYRGSPFIAWEPTDTVATWSQVRLLAPVIPTKVIAIARNYAEHAAELGNETPDVPIIFLKPPTAVIGPLAPIRIPPGVGEVHHEAELAVVIGAVARNVPIEDVGRCILGYTAANDVTAREVQRAEGGRFTRAKGYDTFCPLGPAINTELDPQESLSIVCRVNGELRQAATTSEMLFGIGELLSYVSQVMTLLPGDLILTGTPDGVGPIEPGDKVEVDVEGVGVLVNPVAGR